MKKLIAIPILCIMFLMMQGSDSSTDYTEIVDSLETYVDTIDVYDIDSMYSKVFKYQYLTWVDTGTTTQTDSVKVYGSDSRGNKFECQLQNLSSDSATVISTVTSGDGATTTYRIYPEYLDKIWLIWNGNATFADSVRGDYTLRLVNE